MHSALQHLASLDIEPNTEMVELEAIQQVSIRFQPSLGPPVSELLRADVGAQNRRRLYVPRAIDVGLDDVQPCSGQASDCDSVDVAGCSGPVHYAVEIRREHFVVEEEECDDEALAKRYDLLFEDFAPVAHNEVC